jgi:hypothetical protein
MKLQFVHVHSREEFLELQAQNEINPQLSYEEYVAGCQRTDEYIRQQREALDPFDRAIIEEREADFRRRRQPRAA